MIKKSILLWCLILLVLFLVSIVKSSTNDDIEESFVENINEVEVEQGELIEEDSQEPEEVEIVPEEYEINGMVSETNAQTIITEIISGSRNILPRDIISQITGSDLILELLKSPRGARLAAQRYAEIFTYHPEVFFSTEISEEFYSYLSIFDVHNEINREQISIPTEIIIKTFEIQSKLSKLNLNGFLFKLDQFPDVMLLLSPIYVLPHLINFPTLANPQFFLGYGIDFNPAKTWFLKDFITWNISIQMFLCQAKMDLEYFEPDSETNDQVCDIILKELKAGHEANSDHAYYYFYFNYFNLKGADLSRIPFKINPEDFNAKIFGINNPPFLQDYHFSINDIGNWLGFSDYLKISYKTLSSDQRIIYRMIFYISIFNPSIISTKDRSDLLQKLIRDSHANDFSKAEIRFFVRGCLSNKMGQEIAMIFRTCPNSRFTDIAQRFLSNNNLIFNDLLGTIERAEDRIPFLKIWPNYLNTRLILNHEYFFKQQIRSCLLNEHEENDSSSNFSSPSSLNATKKRRHEEDEDSIPGSNFISHFLSLEQISSLQAFNFGNPNITKTFKLINPDANFINERIDNLMQNLDTNDFGEIAWKKKLDDMKDQDLKSAYIKNEEDLVEFVKQAVIAVYYMKCHLNVCVEIKFIDHSGFGNGLKQEMMDILARVIILPIFKVFFYNPKIFGFIPYPLLHHKMMGVLGFLNGWLLKRDIPVNWYFATNFLKFLFYEEDTEESMQSIIESFYSPLFRTIDGLVDPTINPLDYFPMSFHAHEPFAFTENSSNYVLDLFNPTHNTENELFSYADYFSEDQLNFLNEIIEIPENIQSFEESKIETELAETKEDYSMDEASTEIDLIKEKFIKFKQQIELKTNIVESIRKVVSREIIEQLMLSRFNYIRYLFVNFNPVSQKHLNFDLFYQLQVNQVKEILPEDILNGGLQFENEMEEFKVIGENGEILTPRETLHKVIQSLSKELLKKFYWFCTGCFNLPLGGLKQLPIIVSVTNRILLPTAATCFRTLKFNVHSTLIANIGAMRKSLLNSSGYHYIENLQQTGVNGEVVQAAVSAALENEARSLITDTETSIAPAIEE